MSDKTQEHWREEQATREIGHTEFQRGVKTTLVATFIATIVLVPLLQLTLPQRIDAQRHTHPTPNVPAASALARSVSITATVSKVSSPPLQGAVYRDFMMHLHLSDVAGPSGTHALPNECLLGLLGMHNRIIQPVAAIPPGTRIVATVRPWSDVAARMDGINASQLADDRFLTMPRFWGDSITPEGQDAGPRGSDFLAIWNGRGDALPSSARVPLLRGIRSAWQSGSGWIEAFLNANRHAAHRISLYEKGLDEAAFLTRRLRPPIQALLASLGVGNEKAYVGRNGWLFYVPDVESLVGPGFLDEKQLRTRTRTGTQFATAIQPDPRPAILALHNQLAERGIELVVVPTPVKPTIHPDMFTRRQIERDAPVRNASFDTFVSELRTAGVRIFDPAPLLHQRARSMPQYLASDTHWRPEAMQAVAAALAQEVERAVAADTRVEWQTRPASHTQLGDIATMLAMPSWQRTFAPETVDTISVVSPTGTPWRPDPSANVLLLGDSFTMIYSLAGMGWGDGAGLAEHLALALESKVDRLARNDAGAHASRHLLVDALKRDPHYLDTTRVVVWQFAERELAVGDWQQHDLPTPPKQKRTDPRPIVANAEEAPAAYAQLAADAEAVDAVAVSGDDDWLFLTAELKHLANPPSPQPVPDDPAADPFSAIVDLHHKLSELGITLVMLPVPPRAAIYPDRLFESCPRGADGIPRRLDTGLQTFYQSLRDEGIRVVDITDDLLNARRDEATEGLLCCEQDTHWSPRGLALAAVKVGAEIKTIPELATTPTPFSLTKPMALTYTGDLVEQMNGHPATTSTTKIQRVLRDGHPVSFDPASTVILLADSHGLVFSAGDEMHADGAGLGEHLSFELGFALDVMARRGSGDSVRRDLARRFLQNPEEASSKRVVVYCFAARTLTEARGWTPVPLTR